MGLRVGVLAVAFLIAGCGPGTQGEAPSASSGIVDAHGEAIALSTVIEVGDARQASAGREYEILYSTESLVEGAYRHRSLALFDDGRALMEKYSAVVDPDDPLALDGNARLGTYDSKRGFTPFDFADPHRFRDEIVQVSTGVTFGGDAAWLGEPGTNVTSDEWCVFYRPADEAVRRLACSHDLMDRGDPRGAAGLAIGDRYLLWSVAHASRTKKDRPFEFAVVGRAKDGSGGVVTVLDGVRDFAVAGSELAYSRETENGYDILVNDESGDAEERVASGRLAPGEKMGELVFNGKEIVWVTHPEAPDDEYADLPDDWQPDPTTIHLWSIGSEALTQIKVSDRPADLTLSEDLLVWAGGTHDDKWFDPGEYVLDLDDVALFKVEEGRRGSYIALSGEQLMWTPPMKHDRHHHLIARWLR